MSRLWLFMAAALTLACGSERAAKVAAPAAAPASLAAAAAPPRAATVGVRMAVLDSIGRIRGGAMPEEPRLRTIAQTVAEEAASGHLKWTEVLPALKSRIKADRPVRGAFGVGSTKVLDPKNVDASRMTHALDPAMKHLGLGVASGVGPDGKAHHVVVYIAAAAMRTFGNDAADACIGAGMVLSATPGAQACCEGLTPIGTQQPLANGTCTPLTATRICAACGNGRCGNGENRCSCPADCK